MILITNIQELKLKPPSAIAGQPTAVALGFFDGVHLGHRAVISAAKNSGFIPVVFTFAQHPRAYFGDAPELISDLEDRFSCFEELGVEVVAAVDFSDFAEMNAVEFYAFLRDKLNMIAAFYGYNYHFGSGREGDGELLARLCEKDGIAHTQIAPMLFGGEPISSSRIRAAMNKGDIWSASQMLGRGVVLTAQVEIGKNLGHKLGFATINQPLTACVKPLLRGVYVTSVTIDGITYPAVTNFGARPTVFQTEEAAETHIIGFEGDLYGKTVSVHFLRYLRPQSKFDSVEQLQKQIRKDIEEALKKGWAEP